MAETPYSLGIDQKGDVITAADVYESMTGKRQKVIDQARIMAELTIPSVMPPDGYETGEEIAGNNQSIGAQGVNNLASKLMFLAFPPGQPMLKYEAIQYKLEADINADPELWSLIELALSMLEVEHRKRAMVTPIAATYTEFCKALIVAGNALWKHIDIDKPCFYNLNNYVVKRDNEGQTLLIILKETLAVQTLSDDVKQIVYERTPEIAEEDIWKQQVDIYTVMKLVTSGDATYIGEATGKEWEYWQEYEGELLPDTEYTADYDQPPLYAAWLIPVYGQDYGRSYCEEYRGDLFTVENFMSALNDGASVAAMTLLFTNPGGRTTPRQIKEAENLSVLSGKADDVTVFNLQGKQADFQFVTNNVTEAARRLAYAFLLNRAVQRQGERVTAEEIRRLAVDLDMAMGGLYTMIATGIQGHVVRRFVQLHRAEDKKLPVPPAGVIRMEIATGVGMLGQSLEEQHLEELGAGMNSTFGPKWVEAANVINWARRYSAAKGVNPQGLFKDERQLSQQQDQQKQDVARMTMLDKGTGPVAGELAKALGQKMAEAGQQQQPTDGTQPPGS